MKSLRVWKCLAVLTLVAVPSIALAVSWFGKNVGQLQSTFIGSDCFYFTLAGVTEADPVKPGSPWFAIQRSQFGSKDAYAMLLAAKLSGQTVYVSTNGSLTCGYVTAVEVIMQ